MNIKAIANNIIKQIAYEFPFLMTATVCSTLLDTLFHITVDVNVGRAILPIGANYIMSLGMVLLIVAFRPLHLDRLLKYFFTLIISAYICVLGFCWVKFGCCVDKSMIALISGTNAQEATEFFHVYVTWSSVLLALSCLVAIFSAFVFVLRRSYVSRMWHRILMGTMFVYGCCCLGFSFYTIPGRIQSIIRTEQKDLSEYLSHPNIHETSSEHPDVVMIIIGESFARDHCQLNGYKKKNMPHLMCRKIDGSLLVFQDAVSPATHTAESFKYFMTTYSKETKGKDWYECLTMPEMLSCAGYKCCWISNQAETGWHDNISSSFAHLCNKTMFSRSKGSAELLSEPDGILLPIVKNYVTSINGSKNIGIFVHLMGQHQSYDQRYPKEFACFTAADYKDKPEHQRDMHATFDNATLYNDYVTDSLLNIIKDENAVAVYFSDHGQDFYRSAADYCSHANDNDPVSYAAGTEIPMVIYLSPKYRKLHPEMIKKLTAMTKTNYNTQNLIYLIAELTGYKFSVL